MRTPRLRAGVLLLAALLPAVTLAGAFLRGWAAEPDEKNIDRNMAGSAFDAGRKWAVVIGVNRYLDPDIPKLRYCIADARLVGQRLIAKCGYETERVMLLTDD